ncbi:ADP-heptose--LPS heptosyltransferase 2 [Neolewinella maritima]|uniref:ADP-heptose--LPS heptosyltransferase 2 n=1 Tax=Neolewinella maritima TaxID=1383882 RepID=A0ABN8FB03_9BACT|nr:glycosyltransferase family 9 protein [Neolewinella maritima]CAH1001633.1 ADP-heptose--LPS heptosyltransferase 2 [Neolewinella maritima]
MKLLIVRFSSIGDIVLTTPVIRCLKQQTGAEIHFLTKAAFAPTLRHNPHLTRLWTIKKDIREVGDELISERFTHLIDLHGNLRTLELKQRLTFGHLRTGVRPPRSSTFNKLNVQKFLLTRFRIDRMPDVHIVDRYLATVADLGVVNDGQGLEYFVGPGEEVSPPVADYLAFVIGAAHATKRLEEGQMIDLCKQISYPIVLLGGPGEQEMGERIATTGDHIYNGCGAYALNGSADLVRKARAVITHDTGLMHIAAAYRKRIISVWGNTVPELGMYPYLPNAQPQTIAEVKGLSCRPCSKIGYAACPKGHFRCMRDQNIAEIARRALLAVEA